MQYMAGPMLCTRPNVETLRVEAATKNLESCSQIIKNTYRIKIFFYTSNASRISWVNSYDVQKYILVLLRHELRIFHNHGLTTITRLRIVLPLKR